MSKVKKYLNKYIGEFVYGGIDGLITTFAVVSGGAGANLGSTVIIILGTANLLADGLSMSIGCYLSNKTTFSGKISFNKAVATFLSFNIVGLLPLAIYIVAKTVEIKNEDSLFAISALCTLVGFILVALIKAQITKRKIPKVLIETIGLGVVASVTAFIVGYLLENALS